jgi:hypothetical protein
VNGYKKVFGLKKTRSSFENKLFFIHLYLSESGLSNLLAMGTPKDRPWLTLVWLLQLMPWES